MPQGSANPDNWQIDCLASGEPRRQRKGGMGDRVDAPPHRQHHPAGTDRVNSAIEVHDAGGNDQRWP